MFVVLCIIICPKANTSTSSDTEWQLAPPTPSSSPPSSLASPGTSPTSNQTTSPPDSRNSSAESNATRPAETVTPQLCSQDRVRQVQGRRLGMQEGEPRRRHQTRPLLHQAQQRQTGGLPRPRALRGVDRQQGDLRPIARVLRGQQPPPQIRHQLGMDPPQ